jgi:primosomal protein N' (replication factor Y)
VLDPAPAISPELLGALRDEAVVALCPVGIALNAALPPGSAPRAIPAVALTARGREALRSGAARGPALELLALLTDAARTEADLARRLAGARERIAALERDGLLARTVLERGPRVRPAMVRFVRAAPGIDVEATCGGALARAPRQAGVLRRIAEAGAVALPVLAAEDGRAADLVRSLARRGHVTLEERPAALAGLLDEAPRELVLTEEQRRACDTIGEAVAERRADVFLLHGITGSGKTEVYLRAVAEALKAGRQALVLVPEIPLTHQILGRLRARFGDQLAVLHSGLKETERLAQWEQLRGGHMRIAVGARSALFAPLRNLGIIVVDEEHDGAYKSDEGFRYHVRSLAARRAEADGCPVVLGSATPSLETRHAAEQGRIRHLRLTHRVGGHPLPGVQVVDLARERAALPRGRKLILTGMLLRALRQTLADGAQSLLFLNRRGFSTQIACFQCAHVVRCKHCDISLTYHAGEDRLRCHYCDYSTPPPLTCEGCGSPESSLLGIGTERVEEEVRAHFPDARVARLDRDTASRRGTIETVLGGLHDGSIDIVVGTQMIAKGHDFPGVRLVGVVNADLGLHLPDFRAAERTFQVLTQVAGRSGRAGTPGRVVLQTWTPDHYAVAPVALHDYERFYREELAHRRALGYPPFGSLGQVRVHGPDEDVTHAAAQRVAEATRVVASHDGCEVLGPAPSPIARLRGRYRFQIVLRHATEAAVHRAAVAANEALAGLPTDVRGSVDTRPGDML